MHQIVKVLNRMFLLGVMSIMTVFMAAHGSSAMDTEKGMEEGHDMASHHQHQMLNHGFAMILEGHNMAMVGSMDMAMGVDESAVEHGNMMIKNGKAMWTEAMSGKAMMDMHHEGKDPMKDPAMAYTHKLGEKQLKVIDLLGKMPTMDSGMAVHHQHIMLNHAVQMAIAGANSVMLGDMGMAKGIDEIAVKHGNMMLKNARALFNEIMSGKTMMNMHMDGKTPENDAMMKYTHQLAEAQLHVITLLDEMPGVN